MPIEDTDFPTLLAARNSYDKKFTKTLQFAARKNRFPRRENILHSSIKLPPTHYRLVALKLVFGCKQRNRFREARGYIRLEWDRTAGGQRQN
jgi:hypothetical protein